MFWLIVSCILFLTLLILILLWPVKSEPGDHFDEEQHRIDLFGDKR